MKKDKKRKLKINKKKFLLSLSLLLLIVLLIRFVFQKDILDELKVENRIYSNMLVSVTMNDAHFIKNYSIDPYVSLLKKGETKAAYEMLTDEYRRYKSYEEYLKIIKGIDFSTLKVKEVKQIAEDTFVLPIEYKRSDVLEESKYLVIVSSLNEKVMKISPDNFLYSVEGKHKFSKEGIKYKIEECTVHSDVIKLTVTIKNTKWFKDVTIQEIGLGFSETESKMKNVENGILKPSETKRFTVELDSNYYVPKYLKVNRNIDNEILRTYMFEL